MYMPTAAIMKVVTPIRLAAGMMLTFRKAKVMPTASASMLVATAMRNMVLKPKSSLSSSDLPKDSFIMLPPMKASSTKAIQWSMFVMRCSNRKPSR